VSGGCACAIDDAGAGTSRGATLIVLGVLLSVFLLGRRRRSA
jgi:hypothetical protein